MKNKEFITIGKFSRLMDAYLIASRIESEGIECSLPGSMLAESSQGRFDGTSEIELQVRKKDVDKAIKILKEKQFGAVGDDLWIVTDPEG
ncbi:MAG: hypothetical protein P8Y30_01300 [candidate division WOR-3 bacterium]